MKKPYQLRLDEEMINQVKENAKLNDRSVNAEFRSLIRKSLENTSNCGIYKITNQEGYFYIGKTKNISERLISHINSSSNKKLKESFQRFGYEKHTFEIIEECRIEDLTYKEKFYIDENSDNNFLLNIVLPTGKNKNTVLLDEEKVAFFKKICRLNGNQKPKTQDVVDIAFVIAENCTLLLDEEDFIQIAGLKK